MANADLIIPRFFVHTVPNEAESKKEGRPIFQDIEAIEIRMAANKQTIAVFPAHEVWQWGEHDGVHQEITYAMRFPEQYKRFKAGEAQAMAGTPLEELPFLTQAKRYELKALNIYTAETLASLDSTPLKQLGAGGRELKNQAQAYLDRAKNGALVAHQASEIDALKARIAQLEGGGDSKTAAPTKPATNDAASIFSDMDDDDLKQWIADATGQRPRGNPSHDTLVKIAVEANAELAKKKTEQAAA